MTHDRPLIISVRMIGGAGMGVHLRGHHVTVSAKFGMEGMHPLWWDVEHVSSCPLNRPIRLEDLDRVLYVSAQPQDDALTAPIPGFAKLVQGDVDYAGRAVYKHSTVSLLPCVP